ncbi:hypothetical protein QTP70_014223 [Hemibagrus guttatus]|uniref:ribonuclease H n=1 Tax=Hemibagrus guttatus TaxID=175788 RepID=A0AAE0Q4G5_9TELE|nr:hypothetical protein QTP70_014223 [Hemibagrus guttatus]
MVVCRMTLMVCKKKRSEIEKKTKWWKLKKEECCEEFRQKLRQALGGQVVLPDDWETTAEVIRETGRKVLGVSSGRRKEDKETWWWNEEVQDSIQRKRLAKKKWDMDRTEENRQEYKELQRRVKREVSKAKQKAYDELYTRLDTREGEKDLYRLARQRDRDGKDVQQVRVIKDRDGRVLTSEESVQRRWKEYFEELMNEENEREKRVEGVNSVEQKVDKIRKDEVRKALKRMKSGKAVGPDDIPVEVWKCLGEAAVEFLASLFNRVLESERMPEEWRRSVLVPIFKNKGDVQSCSNYRGIKLMSHTMKVWERVVEARLRKVVEICEQQYGFMPRKSTTDAIFALRILMEKYRDGQRELHCVFVDLEKAYDRVPREELWYCMRKSGVAEKYVRVVQDMYERSRTVVRCAVGQTEEFKVEVGLHQGSALSPFLFAMVMDQLSEEVRQESPWTMMFADDIVICSESREQVEENLERWRFALERRGMKISRSKTEYMCVNEREGSGTVRLQGEEVKKVQEFKYLGSTVQSNGECRKEVKKRVQAGWNGWRKVSGVLCERKISARIKGKVYRTVVRPAMLYGLETVSLRKRQESELEVTELKMLRFSLGVTRLDRIRNEYIRGTAHVGRLGDKVREDRLRWFGHVQRRESEYIGRRMLDMKLPGRRQRGRPKRRYMDVINEDMKLVGASVEDAEDRDRWREMIRYRELVDDVLSLRNQLRRTERNLQALGEQLSQSENDSIDSIKTGSGSDVFPGHVTFDDLHKPGAVKASSYPGRAARSSTPKSAEQKTCARSHSSDSRPRSDRDMENEAAQLRRKLSSVREENSSLVLENRQLISDLEAAQLEIASSKTKMRVLGSTIGAKTSSVSFMKERILDLEAQLEAQAKALQEADLKRAASEQTALQFNRVVEKLREEVNAVKSELCEKTRQWKRMEQQRNQALQNAEKLTLAFRDYKEDVAEKLKKVMENEGKLKTSLVECDRERGELEKRCTELERERERTSHSLSKELKEARVHSEALSAKCQELQAQIQQASEQLDRLQRELKQKEMQLEEVEGLRREREDLRLLTACQEQRLTQTHRDMEQTRAELASLEKVLDMLHLRENRDGALCVNPCFLPSLTLTSVTENLHHKQGEQYQKLLAALQSVEQEKTRQATAAQSLQERLSRAQEEISSLQTSITQRASHYQQLHHQLLDKASQATTVEKEVKKILLNNCITPHIFFFFFRLFPSGVATANHLSPPIPIFCILNTCTH